MEDPLVASTAEKAKHFQTLQSYCGSHRTSTEKSPYRTQLFTLLLSSVNFKKTKQQVRKSLRKVEVCSTNTSNDKQQGLKNINDIKINDTKPVSRKQ